MKESLVQANEQLCVCVLCGSSSDEFAHAQLVVARLQVSLHSKNVNVSNICYMHVSLVYHCAADKILLVWCWQVSLSRTGDRGSLW